MIKNSPWQVKASIIILVIIVAAILCYKHINLSFEVMFNGLLLFLGIAVGVALSYFIETHYEGF